MPRAYVTLNEDWLLRLPSPLLKRKHNFLLTRDQDSLLLPFHEFFIDLLHDKKQKKRREKDFFSIKENVILKRIFFPGMLAMQF